MGGGAQAAEVAEQPVVCAGMASAAAISAGPAALQALCAIARFHQIAADPATLAHQLGLQPSEAVTAGDLLRAAKLSGPEREAISHHARPTGTDTAACACRRCATHDGGTDIVVILAQCDGQAGAVPGSRGRRAQPPDDRAHRSLRRAVDRRADPDRQPRQPGRRARPIRFLLVHPRPGQVPQAARRGAADLLHAAAVLAGQPAVLSGGDGQGAGAPGPHDPRRAGHGPDRGGHLRERPHGAALLRVQPHHQPHRRGAGGAPVPPPRAAAAGLFPGPARWRLGRPRARAGEHPQLPDRQRPHRAAGRGVLGRLHRRHAVLQRAAHLDRAGQPAAVLLP